MPVRDVAGFEGRRGKTHNIRAPSISTQHPPDSVCARGIHRTLSPSPCRWRAPRVPSLAGWASARALEPGRLQSEERGREPERGSLPRPA